MKLKPELKARGGEMANLEGKSRGSDFYTR